MTVYSASALSIGAARSRTLAVSTTSISHLSYWLTRFDLPTRFAIQVSAGNWRQRVTQGLVALTLKTRRRIGSLTYGAADAMHAHPVQLSENMPKRRKTSSDSVSPPKDEDPAADC